MIPTPVPVDTSFPSALLPEHLWLDGTPRPASGSPRPDGAHGHCRTGSPSVLWASKSHSPWSECDTVSSDAFAEHQKPFVSGYPPTWSIYLRRLQAKGPEEWWPQVSSLPRRTARPARLPVAGDAEPAFGRRRSPEQQSIKGVFGQRQCGVGGFIRKEVNNSQSESSLLNANQPQPQKEPTSR